MKVLVVGGTGLTGAHAALYLQQQGMTITLCSRSANAVPALQGFAHVRGSYLDDDVAGLQLQDYDALVFAAGADIRQLPPTEDDTAFFERVNSKGVPEFFARAKQAGVRRAVYIGTYYPQVVPNKIQSSPYVRSRFHADEGVRALSDDSFTVCSLNAPFILGHVDGVALPHLEALVHYAAGRLEGVPVVAPAGGVNHISSQSMSEAIHNALHHGQGGKAYLVGDENLSWKAYLELFFNAAGNPVDLAVSTQEHPLFPDIIMYAGRNATVSYEPEVGELDYSRNCIAATVDEVVKAYL
ncbi:MAG: NAD(P)-dependent oxidoreductase [Gammaproteobacteria bacterium]|nr:NAD(P)-dependent oxidoreductase [Gammaproteobacteria bacterium]